jgi:hypothetical protein
MGWRNQLLDNLEECSPDLLESMQKKGTLEKYLDDTQKQAIEMSKKLREVARRA